nr:DEAD/DEAH box helicase [Hydrogenophaga sp.]
MSRSTQPDAAAWLAARGWSPFPFQQDVWDAMARGESGLLHATTGAGKTYAVWLGALQALADAEAKRTPPLTVVWLTPMRALAADSLRALKEPLPDLAPAWTAGARSGDTSSSERAKQTQRLPTVLVTTPESLSLLIDEWHELMGNKRGVQTQLAIARLRRWNPGLMVWGMSATLGNLDEALHTLLGPQAAATGRLVRGQT